MWLSLYTLFALLSLIWSWYMSSYLLHSSHKKESILHHWFMQWQSSQIFQNESWAIHSSTYLLKCGFAKMQICKNTAMKSMCNSSNLLIKPPGNGTFSLGHFHPFSRAVSILDSCEHFSEHFFLCVVSIFLSCEQFFELWALAAPAGICKSCKVTKILTI